MYSNSIHTLGDDTDEADENMGHEENDENYDPERQRTKEDVNGTRDSCSKGISELTPTVTNTTTRADPPTYKPKTISRTTMPNLTMEQS